MLARIDNDPRPRRACRTPWSSSYRQHGAPTAMVEKIPRPVPSWTPALRTLEDHLGRRAGCRAMPIECGGINSMIPAVVAARPTGRRRRRMGARVPRASMDNRGLRRGAHGSPSRSPVNAVSVSSSTSGTTTARWNGSSCHHHSTRRRGHRRARDDRRRREAHRRAMHPPRRSPRARAQHPPRHEQHRSPFDAIAETLAPTLYSYNARTSWAR